MTARTAYKRTKRASKTRPFRFLYSFCRQIPQNRRWRFVRCADYSNLLQFILDFWPVFMPCKVLDSLRVHPGIQQVGDIGVAQQMWCHMEIQCIVYWIINNLTLNPLCFIEIDLVHFICPVIDDRVCIDLVKVLVNTLRQFSFGIHPYPFQHLSGHLTEKAFNHI